MSRFARFAITSSDPTLPLLIAILEALPRQDRNEILAFLELWLDLPGEDRAVFAKTLKPSLSEEAVARLSGVTTRTLQRWERYQAIRPTLADYRDIRRRPAKRRASAKGTWITLDDSAV